MGDALRTNAYERMLDRLGVKDPLPVVDPTAKPVPPSRPSQPMVVTLSRVAAIVFFRVASRHAP